MKMRTQQPKICGTLGKQSKREIHSITGLSQKKQEKAQINNLTSNLKEHEKEQQAMPNMNRWKEIIKIRTEMKGIESFKKYKKSINPRAASLKG